ncbi:MAG: hypothetical protein K8R12_00620 [Desulfobacterales bacterium]|nr:hypothetical protein [Desulfobacterales bacterium]MCD4777452.1 hypothetical protein [Desulfobacterales bacterium]
MDKEGLTKRITIKLQSKPHEITAYDFDTILFNNGLMVVSSSGKDREYRLPDLIKFTIT